MEGWLKQSTAVDIAIGPFLDDADGKTAETALTISQADVRLKKNNGSWAQKNDSNAATHEENGNYEVALDATDTNTLGILRLHVAESGALPVWASFMVLPANVYDSLFGSDKLEVDLIQMGGVAQSATDLKDFADDGYDPSTNKVQGVVLTDTVTTYTGNTPQTGDAFARLGAPAGASVSADILAVDNLVDDLESRIGTPSNLGGGATIAQNLSDIESQTDDIGASGAGLTAVPWNASWDAEVQSEVSDALVAAKLDKLIAASGTVSNPGSGTATVFRTSLTDADDTWNDQVIVITSGALNGQSRPVLDYEQTNGEITVAEAFTDAPSDAVTFIILASHVHPVSQIQSGLATPTNITAGTITTVTNLTNAPTNGDLTATMKTSVTTAATAATPVAASVAGNVGGNVTGSVGSLAAQAKADVNAEVVDALATDTYAEPGQGTPSATLSLTAKIGYLFKAWRNKSTQTSSQYSLFNDDASTVDQKSTASDDGTTFTRGEVATGP